MVGWNCFWFIGMKPEARFAGWVARLTLALCIIGIIQAWAFIQSERAFIALDSMSIVDGIQTGKPLITSLTFRNSGKSPALDVVVHYNSNITLPNVPQYGPNRTEFTPIVSEGKATMHFGAPAPMQQTDVDALKTGKLEFYVWGYISFEDHFSVFGQEVGFCAIFDWRSPAGNTFLTCPRKGYLYAR